MSGPPKKLRKSSPPLKWPVHQSLKRLRTTCVSFQLLFRRPRHVFLLLFALILLLLLLSILAVTLGVTPFSRMYYTALHKHPTHAILALAHRPGLADTAFSEEACARKFDQAWAVQNDDGKIAAQKDIVSIAYFVQAGNDSVPLLSRLFARIHHPSNFYVLHVDAKVDKQARRNVQNMIERNPRYASNVHIMKSEMVTYKAISMVTNTMAAMTIALERHADWDYFINLSGTDYPLVSPEGQMKLLARPRVPPGRLNFVTFFPYKEWGPYSFRVRNMHWDPAAVGFQSPNSRLRLLKSQKETPLEQHRAFVFTKAEAWVILSRPFVKFVVRSAFAKRMLINHAHVLSVPEHYFADILYNHPFWRKTIVPDAFRKVVWYLKNQRSGQHPYPIDGGPTIFSRWSYIARTRSLFARKFVKPDSQLMDRIDLLQSGAGDEKGDSRFRELEHERAVFYNRIVRHFDLLTQKTLELQGYYYPRSAYPSSY